MIRFTTLRVKMAPTVTNKRRLLNKTAFAPTMCNHLAVHKMPQPRANPVTELARITVRVDDPREMAMTVSAIPPNTKT